MRADSQLLEVMDKINAYLAGKYRQPQLDISPEKSEMPAPSVTTIIDQVMPRVTTTATRYFFMRSLGNLLNAPPRRTKQGYEDYPPELGLAVGEFAHAIDNLMNMLENGEITPEEWQEQFNGLVAYFMLTGYALGSGELPDEEAQQNLSSGIESQLAFLGAFAALVKMAADNGTLRDKMPAFRRRAQMYATAMVAPFWRGKTIGLPLPALPGDMSTQCGQNCKCQWEIHWLDYTRGDADAYWVLRPAEHCQTCKERAERWNPLRIRNHELILPDVTFMERVRALTEKHLPGRHDQRTHGNWASDIGFSDEIVETTSFLPIDPKYLHSKSGIPTPNGIENYFNDHPDGMLVYRVDLRADPRDLPTSTPRKSETLRKYFILHRNVREGNPSPRNPTGISGRWRVTFLNPDQTPTGHYSADSIPEILQVVDSALNEFYRHNSTFVPFRVRARVQFLGTTKELSLKGGVGSGHYGHAGRPGKRGGSLPGEGHSGVLRNGLELDIDQLYKKYPGLEKIFPDKRVFKYLMSEISKNDFSLASGDEIKEIRGTLLPTVRQTPHGKIEWQESYEFNDEQREMYNRILKDVFNEKRAYIHNLLELPSTVEELNAIVGTDVTKLTDKDEIRAVGKKFAEHVVSRIPDTPEMARLGGEIETYVWKCVDTKSLPEETKNVIERDILFFARAFANKKAEFVSKHHISLGTIKPEEAGIRDEGEWKDLPETTYHVTTSANKVLASRLMSRYELKMNEGAIGLGGGDDDTISVTTSIDTAKAIERALHEAHAVANGKLTVRGMLDSALRGGGGVGRDWSGNLLDFFGSVITSTRQRKVVAKAVQELIDFQEKGIRPWRTTNSLSGERRQLTDEEMWDRIFDFFKYGYMSGREHSGGYFDPLFFGTNFRELGKLNPKQFKTLKLGKANPKVRGKQKSSLGEWRVVGGDTVSIADVVSFFNAHDLKAIMGTANIPESSISVDEFLKGLMQ